MKRRAILAICALVLAALSGCAGGGDKRVPPANIPVGPLGAPAAVLPPVKTGKVKIDFQRMLELQEQVDKGHQPWRLDPLEAAMEEGRQYGFDPAIGDRFELEKILGEDTVSGTAEAYVEARRQDGTRYEILLIQPNDPGEGLIWTISSIRLKK